jgi:hypothetical protein
MTQTVANVVLPGPCLVYIAPYSSSALEAAPANTITKGTAWGGNWVEVGYTKGGVALQLSTEAFAAEYDQANAPVHDFITKQGATVTFAAGEATLTNIKQALGYGTTTSGSTESTLGVSGTDGLQTYYSLGFEVLAPGLSSTKYRRALVWKAKPMGDFELAGKKDEDQVVGYSFEARYEAQASATERLWKLIDRQVA